MKTQYYIYNGKRSELPIVTLSNGLRIGNFSSPHTFEFEDGSILQACSNQRAEYLKIDFIERKIPQEINNKVVINNIELTFKLTENVIEKVRKIMFEYRRNLEVDLILIPLPMLTALKESDFIYYVENDNNIKNIIDTPFRVIKMKSRLDKKVRIDDFCV